MICFTFLCSLKSKFQLFFKLVDLVEKNFYVKIINFVFTFTFTFQWTAIF